MGFGTFSMLLGEFLSLVRIKLLLGQFLNWVQGLSSIINTFLPRGLQILLCRSIVCLLMQQNYCVIWRQTCSCSPLSWMLAWVSHLLKKGFDHERVGKEADWGLQKGSANQTRGPHVCLLHGKLAEAVSYSSPLPSLRIAPHWFSIKCV